MSLEKPRKPREQYYCHLHSSKRPVAPLEILEILRGTAAAAWGDLQGESGAGWGMASLEVWRTQPAGSASVSACVPVQGPGQFFCLTFMRDMVIE